MGMIGVCILIRGLQIAMRMRHGVILPGQDRFELLRWKVDSLPEAHYDDKLFGYCVRISERIRTRDPGLFSDNILYTLFKMGIYDWEDPNKRNDQAMQAMRHSTAMADCLLQRIFDVERAVSVDYGPL